jgi:soluble lytic murein transglycosylase
MPSLQRFRSQDSRRRAPAAVAAACTLALFALCESPGFARQAPGRASDPPGLVPTVHPAVPASWNETWLVPEPGNRDADSWRALAEGIGLYEAGSFAAASAKLDDPRLASSPLAGYTAYYAGLAALRAQRLDDARSRLEAARAKGAGTALAERATLALAEFAESAGDAAGALRLYDEALSAAKPAAPEQALAGVMRSALATGDTARASAAALRLYAEFPGTPQAESAVPRVDALRQEPARAPDLAKRDLERAARLFDARDHAAARTAFERVRLSASGDDLELADLRIAECDLAQRRHRAAADRLAPYLDRSSRLAETRYHHALALRGLGRGEEFATRARALADEFPDTRWAEDALNHLASHYLTRDQDDAALAVFARIVDRYPGGRHSERAAWKLGWARYGEGQFAEAAAVFDRGATGAPRSDYRPAWLYWGGRARERSGDTATAIARYQLAVVDYRNSYYGRLAGRALAAMKQPVLSASAAQPIAAGSAAAGAGSRPASPPPVPATNATLVRALLGLDLLGLGRAEVQYAQRTWGTSAPLEATLAWIHHQEGELRKGIAAMRRAYPQFLTASGDQLPLDVQRVIFPLDYWPLIRRYASAHDLDPYLVAALIAQESTFQADAKSTANAYGLMQIIPSTGRKLARSEGLRRFRVSNLTDPETNIRLGTKYFAGLLGRFGGAHFALAGYNAGESRVVRWQANRPGAPADEFVDAIPFPETQNYVKRILGTADDYRRLYGDRAATPEVARRAPSSSRPVAAKATGKVASPAKRTSTSAKGPAKAKAKAKTKTLAAVSARPRVR